MPLIPYNETRTPVAAGLKEHLGIPIVRQNQNAPAPAYPYGSYTITTLASANKGTWERYEGTSRKMVKQTWSLSFMSENPEESVELAVRARNWLDITGRNYLKDRGIIVQSMTDITNRDNFLTAGYEYKQGFDVVFYLFDTVENTDEIIENAVFRRETSI